MHRLKITVILQEQQQEKQQKPPLPLHWNSLSISIIMKTMKDLIGSDKKLTNSLGFQ